MQNITITGRIGKDAETRKTQQGESVCSFNVAVDQGYGQNKSTNWFRISLWGKRGDSLAPYLLKGSDVTVNGEFSLGEYQGKPQLDVRANDVALQGGKRDASNTNTAREYGHSQRQAPAKTNAFLDDDVPDFGEPPF